MRNSFILSLMAGAFILLGSMSTEKLPVLTGTDTVADVLEALGDTPLPHKPDMEITGVSAERGKNITLYGVNHEKGANSRKQSKHFVCTSCHNIQKDVPDLSVTDPQKQLEYVRDNNIPYLQGTALYGAINRTSFYNGDYEKKYGDLVKPARNSLRESIQLCAIECSQGRRLDKAELESVLAYLWTIGLKMEDLNLSDSEWDLIRDAKEGKKDKAEAIQVIKSHYLDHSPATFVKPPEDRKKGYGLKGNPENGQLIYELSCKHCHAKKRYSFFNLDDSKNTFKYLKKHFAKYTRYSTYQVARYGTSPMHWKRAYMPQYTLEKMTNQQLEDLRAYIEQEAGK